jgi:hypothetical protein
MSITSAAEWINDLSAYLYAYDKDCPAKVWANAPLFHPAIARALHIDRSETGGVYALAPFRLAMIGENHRILAAWPCPRILTADPEAHLVIDAVIAWNPVDNSAQILGDPVPQLAGRFPDSETSSLFADPRAFFQAWAMARAAFFVHWCAAKRKDWESPPAESDLIPGCLLIGEPAKVNWHRHDLPKHLDCVGIDPRTVNNAILKTARLPRVTGQANARAVA